MRCSGTSSTSDVAGERDGAQETKDDPTAGMTPEQRVHWMMLHRKKEGIEERSTRLACARTRSAC